MNILIANNTRIPVKKYGGTERIIWWLGKELHKQGHKITYLVGPKSYCPFARVLQFASNKPLHEQIPDDIDIAHIHFPIRTPLQIPYIVTTHGNAQPEEELDINTVFISKNHAQRHNSNMFVYNGIGIEEYGKVNLSQPREHLLFLGKTNRRKKNLKDCKYIANQLGEKLMIIGGYGLSFNRKIQYKGFLGGKAKIHMIQKSKALLFPVRWHEPFGLAIIESLYFGCPVFGTRYGSLVELIPEEMGFLSNNITEIIEALRNLDNYDRKRCYEYVCDNFTSNHMTDNYLELYQKVLAGEKLNSKKPINKSKIKSTLLSVVR